MEVVWGSELVPQGSGRTTLFASSDSFSLATIYTLQTDDTRQTENKIVLMCHERQRLYGRLEITTKGILFIEQYSLRS